MIAIAKVVLSVHGKFLLAQILVVVVVLCW